MVTALYILIILTATVFLGWFPVCYRRFSRDGQGRVMVRSLIWSFSSIVVAAIVGEFTYKLPPPGIYPVAVLFLPLPFNIIKLVNFVRQRNARISNHEKVRILRA